MKRMFGLFAVMALLCLGTLRASAAEPVAVGKISDSNLSAMGLAGMTVVSDTEGTKVRGMGNAVSGGSYAWSFMPPFATSHNVYNASGSTHSLGSNHSYAGFGAPNYFGVISPVSVLGGFLTGTGALGLGGSFAMNN